MVCIAAQDVALAREHAGLPTQRAGFWTFYGPFSVIAFTLKCGEAADSEN